MAKNKAGRKPSVEDIVEQAKLLSPAELQRVTEELLTFQTELQITWELHIEPQLLQKIQQKWAPEKQTRYEELVALRREERITSKELQELVSLSDEAERRNADRMNALVALAVLRQVSLDELMQQLGIVAPPVI
jgi:hypothetical protein